MQCNNPERKAEFESTKHDAWSEQAGLSAQPDEEVCYSASTTSSEGASLESPELVADDADSTPVEPKFVTGPDSGPHFWIDLPDPD